MHQSALYASNEVKRLLKEREANLDPTFVKCMGAAVNMLNAMRVELFPFHILRVDKRARMLSITEDILMLVKRFTQQVKSEYRSFRLKQSTLSALPTLPCESEIDLTDLTPLIHLVTIIEHWKKSLPPLRRVSRSVEFSVLDHFSTFYQQAIFIPFCESNRSPNDISSITLKPGIDAIALGLEDLNLAYKGLNDCRVDVEQELEAAFRRIENIPIEWKRQMYQLSLGSIIDRPSSMHDGLQDETEEPIALVAPQLPARQEFQDLSQIDLIKKFTAHGSRLPETKPYNTGKRVVSSSSQETVTPKSLKPHPPPRSKKRPPPFSLKSSDDEDSRSILLPPNHADDSYQASKNLEMSSFVRSSSTKSSSAKSKSAPENIYPTSVGNAAKDLRRVHSEPSETHAERSPSHELFPRMSDGEKVGKDEDKANQEESPSYSTLELSNSPVDSSLDLSSPSKLSFTAKIKGKMGYSSRCRQHKSKRSNTTQSTSSGTSSSPYTSQHASRSQSRTGLHIFPGSLGSVKEHGVLVPPLPTQPAPRLHRTKTEPEYPILVKDFAASTSFGSVASSDSAKSESKPSMLKRIRSIAQISVRDRNNTWPG